MRFLMLNWRDPRNPKTGGAERVTFAHLKALVDRGHEVFWFANDFPGAAPEESLDGLRIVRGGGYGSSVLAARKWYRQQPRFDLVMDQHHGIPWYAPWWTGTNTVAYIHEVLGPIWGAFYNWPISTVGPWQERWTHRVYRRIPFWVPSESTRKALLTHGVREVRVLDNGVDLEPLAHLEPKVPQPPVKMICVSRLAPNKRVDHALRCLHELGRRGMASELTILGDGMTAGALRELSGRLGLTDRVRFAGYQPESVKAALLREHHLLLHPSVREGWGLNVIEANAMGTPAVVYPVAGLVDSTVDGETGVVCRSETPEALADGVQSLVAGPEGFDRIRRAAWERSFRFRWESVIPVACDFLEGGASRGKMG